MAATSKLNSVPDLLVILLSYDFFQILSTNMTPEIWKSFNMMMLWWKATWHGDCMLSTMPWKWLMKASTGEKSLVWMVRTHAESWTTWSELVNKMTSQKRVQLLIHYNFLIVCPTCRIKKSPEVQYPASKYKGWRIHIKVLCMLTAQISGCLCAALRWTQTECHCVLNSPMRKLLREQCPLFVLWGITCCSFFNSANSIFQTVNDIKLDLLKALLSRGRIYFVLLLFFCS